MYSDVRRPTKWRTKRWQTWIWISTMKKTSFFSTQTNWRDVVHCIYDLFCCRLYFRTSMGSTIIFTLSSTFALHSAIHTKREIGNTNAIGRWIWSRHGSSCKKIRRWSIGKCLHCHLQCNVCFIFFLSLIFSTSFAHLCSTSTNVAKILKENKKYALFDNEFTSE